jgi:hypothetical protein
MLGIGALVAGWTTYGCYTNLKNDSQWRVPLAIQIVPAVVLATLILLFPESPRWLLDHDKYVALASPSAFVSLSEGTKEDGLGADGNKYMTEPMKPSQPSLSSTPEATLTTLGSAPSSRRSKRLLGTSTSTRRRAISSYSRISESFLPSLYAHKHLA